MNYVIQGHGRQEVAVVGTPEALGTDSCRYVLVQACTDNTQTVTIGTAGVDGTIATRDGISLAAADILPVFAQNLSEIYVDALINGEGVTFVYFRQMDAAVVAEALGAEVTVADITGGQRFYVKRGDRTAKFDVQGDTLNWVDIQSPGEGWLDEAAAFVKTVAPEYGIKHVLAAAGSERAYGALTNRGFVGDKGALVLEVG